MMKLIIFFALVAILAAGAYGIYKNALKQKDI
jgi:Tfp pilus assembly protein PilE